MPLEITAEQLATIWDDQETARDDMSKRQDYYDGKHAIVGRDETYADGAKKEERVANWIAYMVNRYVGLITSTPYQVTNKDDDGENEGPATYGDIADENRVRGQDVSNLRTALIHGHSIELHEFDKDIVISQHDPRNWALIHDSNGGMVGAIYRIDLPANTITDGVLVKDEQHLMWVYDEARIRAFTTNKAGKWIEGDEVKHEFGRVPVVVWSLNDTASSFITDAMIGLNDEYNEIFSAGGDDVRRDVDAILAVAGFGSAELLEAMPVIRTEKLLPMPEEGSAEYLTRQSDVEPSTRHLQRTRQVLHMSGEVPDIEDITGATGSASGIALKLKFLPMLQAASSMANNIESGMRDRIDLINAVVGKRSGGSTIEDYNVVIQFTLPTNSIEEWSNINNLDGVVSHKTMLELLSDIDDPEAELKRIEDEGVLEDDDEGLTPEAAAAKQDMKIDKLAEDSAPAVAEMIDAITLAVTEHIIQSGAIDRAASQQRAAE